MILAAPRRLASLATVTVSIAASAAFAQPLSGNPAPPVMGWVPAYGIDAATQALKGTPGIGSALTRMGLQFWNPSVDGKGIVFAPVDATGKPVNPRQVEQLQRWAHAHGIQPLLTVYNNSQVINRWDWPLARHAFVDHRDEFVAALVAAVETYRLDGVDVDLEGEGDADFGPDRAAYAAFIHALSVALKARGKLVTVDSFHSPCANAPNMRWWGDWVGDVAAVHSMGYEDLYEGNAQPFTPEGKPVCEGGAAVFRYSWQVDYALRAGYRRDQVVLGMPTWVDSWGSGGLGPTLADHLREVRALGAGVALWDLQLNSPGWNRPVTWEVVQAVRHPGTVVARRAGSGGLGVEYAETARNGAFMTMASLRNASHRPVAAAMPALTPATAR